MMRTFESGLGAWRLYRLLGFVILILAGAAPSWAQPDASNHDAQCQALATVDFSSVTDAPTQITQAKLVSDLRGLLADVEVSERLARSIGSVSPTCRVSGYVTPNVGFVLMLPASGWNGKLLHIGCVGWCGSTDFQTVSCALHPAYVCVGTDMGHTGAGGLWARNNLQAQIDFSYRATHVTTLAAKAILERFYSQSAKQSYFMGCSTGGYQALVEAQRFPSDFNGIVAGAPDMDESDLAVRGLWVKRSLLGDDGKPVFSRADIELLHEAVLNRCDMDDGVKDGIVSAPYRCRFDAAELQCKTDAQTACLSARQVEAARKIYGRPVTSKGQPISARGVFPGSELEWTEAFSDTWGDHFFQETALISLAGKEWKFTDFDFDRDPQRSGVGVLYPDTNPDLRRFRDGGGKLLSYQGDNDMSEMPGAAFDYYETVEKTMGGREATQSFYRLFSIPGMNHCTGGDGAFVFDYLSHLEAWVEQGKAPDVMIGSHVSGLKKYEGMTLKMPLDPATTVTFTRPVYPYPRYPKYKGSGDVNDAGNFRSAE